MYLCRGDEATIRFELFAVNNAGVEVASDVSLHDGDDGFMLRIHAEQELIAWPINAVKLFAFFAAAAAAFDAALCVWISFFHTNDVANARGGGGGVSSGDSADAAAACYPRGAAFSRGWMTPGFRGVWLG